jgi:replicative DNA helicase
MQRDAPALREPPWSQPAETAVLGAMLQDNATFDAVGDLIQSAHFFAHAHSLVFESIAAMVLSGKPADVVTVFEDLQRRGKAEEVGGLEYLTSLAQYQVSARNARSYAKIIAEQAMLRGLVQASGEIAALAYDLTGLTVAERLDRAQQTLQAVQAHSGRTMPSAMSESVVALLDRIQSRHDGVASRGITTGIADLDRLLGGGFKPGKQVIVAARPSVGKSSFAQQLCLNVARAGHAAAFLSQEMSREELVDRGAANLGRLDLDRVISGDLGDEDWSRLTEAVERMRDLPLFLDDQPALTLHDIAAKARHLKRQNDLKVLVIDYIQLCAGGADKDSRHHQIEQLSRGLKNLAKQLEITVITLSQLNREVEKRTSGRPVLSDLKESGSIEEDADVVMLLSRNGEEQGGLRTINCDIPKNRQGKTGGLSLGFNGAHQEWLAMAAPMEFRQPARRHYTEDV